MLVKNTSKHINEGWMMGFANGQRELLEGVSRAVAFSFVKYYQAEWARPYKRIDENTLKVEC